MPVLTGVGVVTGVAVPVGVGDAVPLGVGVAVPVGVGEPELIVKAKTEQLPGTSAAAGLLEGTFGATAT